MFASRCTYDGSLAFSTGDYKSEGLIIDIPTSATTETDEKNILNCRLVSLDHACAASGT